jgi:hypothetical protein
MTGPWIIASLVAAGLGFYRGLYKGLTKRLSYLIVSTGGVLALIGLLAFGLGIDNSVKPQATPSNPFSTSNTASQISLPLLSLQLGILAGGTYALDSITRPLLARSASFTSSNITVAQRSIGDMHGAVIMLRNLAAGVFVLVMPNAVAVYGALRSAVIGLSITQAMLTCGAIALWEFFDESIWRADGMVMGLVDLRLLKQPVSFFETD